MDITAAEDKLAALKQLLGYNAVSASKLSRNDIRKLLKTWSRTSGAVRWINSDELFRTLFDIKVCPHSDILGCLAFYWSSMLAVIREEGDRDGGVYMICFPFCKELYMYDTFIMFNAAVGMGQDLCMHLGSDFFLTVFHPRYKNAPSLFSPERHAPFPTAGLDFTSEKRDKRLASEDSFFMNKQRLSLERLFNSAAASEPNDVVPLRGESQIPSFYSTGTVIDCTKTWFISRIHKTNGALKHANTVEERWFESKAILAEEAYADVWVIIRELYEVGNDKKGVIVSAVLVAPRFSAFNAAQWRQFAITINATLKRVAREQLSIEIFHPEYTGKKSASNERRRSPFPSMLISCKI